MQCVIFHCRCQVGTAIFSAEQMPGEKMATLMIDGTLDLTQFWNQGESDADTNKLVIDITGISRPIHY
jgi:hypothetical protein